MRGGLILIVLALMMGIQAPLLHALNLSGYAMDIAMIGTLHFASGPFAVMGLVLSSLLGLIQDALTPGALLGMNMEIMVVVYLVARGLSQRFQLHSPLPLIVAVLVFSFLKAILFFLLSVLFDRSFGDYIPLLIEAIPHAVVTAILAPLVSWVLMGMDRGMSRHGHRGPLIK